MQKKSIHNSSNERITASEEKHFSGFEVGFVAGMILFPVFFTVIVPYIHELWHVLCLELYGCDYVLEFDYSVLHGLHAQTTFSMATCKLSLVQDSVVVLAGVAGNILLSIPLFLISWTLARRWHFFFSIFMLFVAVSFLTSTSLNFFFEDGDPMIFMNSINMQHYDFIVYLSGILIVLASFFSFYKSIVYITDRELQSEFQIFDKEL